MVGHLIVLKYKLNSKPQNKQAEDNGLEKWLIWWGVARLDISSISMHACTKKNINNCELENDETSKFKK